MCLKHGWLHKPCPDCLYESRLRVPLSDTGSGEKRAEISATALEAAIEAIDPTHLQVEFLIQIAEIMGYEHALCTAKQWQIIEEPVLGRRGLKR